MPARVDSSQISPRIGQLVEGEELKNWVKIARDTQCTFILDEIYSRSMHPALPVSSIFETLVLGLSLSFGSDQIIVNTQTKAKGTHIIEGIGRPIATERFI